MVDKLEEYEQVKEQMEQAIDYYDHRLAELVEDRQRELGNPKFMEITDLKAKAMGEAIAQIIAIDGIEIRTDNQSLPECNIVEQINFDKHTFKYRDQSVQSYCPLLKPDSTGKHWVAVIPKEKS